MSKCASCEIHKWRIYISNDDLNTETYFILQCHSIGLEKSGYQVNIFSYFCMKTYVVGTH